MPGAEYQVPCWVNVPRAKCRVLISSPPPPAPLDSCDARALVPKAYPAGHAGFRGAADGRRHRGMDRGPAEPDGCPGRPDRLRGARRHRSPSIAGNRYDADEPGGTGNTPGAHRGPQFVAASGPAGRALQRNLGGRCHRRDRDPGRGADLHLGPDHPVVVPAALRPDRRAGGLDRIPAAGRTAANHGAKAWRPGVRRLEAGFPRYRGGDSRGTRRRARVGAGCARFAKWPGGWRTK